MAFRGDLKNVQLADLFQTLAQNRQRGTLTVHSQGRIHKIAFTGEGVTLLDPKSIGRRRLGEILLSAGLVTEEDLASAARDQAKARTYLGEALVRAGRITQADLDRILATQIEEEIYEVFRIDSGTFEFLECDERELRRTAIRNSRALPVDQVVLEAARRLDEWRLISRHVPSIDAVFHAAAPPGSIAADDEDALVLARLDGCHSVRDIADALVSSSFVVAKVVARLVEQGHARPASTEELFAAARELLAGQQRARGVRLLHRLKETLPAPSPLDAQLAELFAQGGDLAAAAATRVRVAEAAAAAGRPDSARHELEKAIREAPGSVAVLEPLAAALRALGDAEAELARRRELCEAHLEEGNVPAAILAVERVIELAPEDAAAHRRYSDLCLRARMKEKAVDVLERDAQRLRREKRVTELAAVYKRILAIDGGRRDVKRALIDLRRTRLDRTLRVAGIGVLVLALAGTSGVLGLRSRAVSRQLDAIARAGALLDAGDARGAHSLVTAVLAGDPQPEVVKEAIAVLDRTDEALREATRIARESREADLSARLAEVQAAVDSQRWDAALRDLLALIEDEDEDEAWLAERARTRLAHFEQSVRDRVERATAFLSSWRAPEHDDEVAAANARMCEAFPADLAAAMPRMQAIARDAAPSQEPAVRAALLGIAAAAEAFESARARLQPEADALRERHERLEVLERLSTAYLDAARAAESGDVERSRQLLRKVLLEYGSGEISGMLEERLARLDAAAAALRRVETLIASGEIARAHDEARAAAEQYADLRVPATLGIPVLVESLPSGALVRVDGAEAGATPVILRLPLGSAKSVELSLPRRPPQSVAIDVGGGARRLIEIPRESLASTRLDGTVEAALVEDGGRFLVAGREGRFHEITREDSGELRVRTFATTSISGAIAPPVALPDGFLATCFDGQVHRIDSSGPALVARFSRPLDGEELPFAPIVHEGTALVVTERGRAIALSLDDGSELWRTDFGGARVLGAPARIGERVFVPLAGGEIAIVALAAREVVGRSRLGIELTRGLATDGVRLVAPTATGQLLVLDPADAGVIGSIALGDVAIDLPRLDSGYACVALGKSVVLADLERGRVTRTWTGVAPTRAPARVGSQLWVPCEGGVVQVLDAGSDALLESVRFAGGALAGPAVPCGDAVALLSRAGELTLLRR